MPKTVGASRSSISSERISFISDRRRSISSAEVEKPSSASFAFAEGVEQSAVTCSRMRSKPIFSSKFAG